MLSVATKSNYSGNFCTYPHFLPLSVIILMALSVVNQIPCCLKDCLWPLIGNLLCWCSVLLAHQPKAKYRLLPQQFL
jgi:hypothetical protein